jgi:hypothetical protein
MSQQTFTQNINKTIDRNKRLWIQDNPPKPKNTMINPNNNTFINAPICIIKTPNCTSDNITNNCKITCMPIDNSNKINYIFNIGSNWREDTS